MAHQAFSALSSVNSNTFFRVCFPNQYPSLKRPQPLPLGTITVFRGRLRNHTFTRGHCNYITCAVSHGDNNLKSAIDVPSVSQYPPSLWKDDFIDSVTIDNVASNEDDERMETLISEIKAIFHSMHDGETSPSAYDTAWVARVAAIDGSNRPQFPQTLDWILHNQLPDGSWGEERFFLSYDRLLNTLACLITLTIWGAGNAHVHKGLEFIHKHAQQMEDSVDSQRPSGFETVFTAMLKEAKSLGLDLPYELPILEHILKKREAKLKRIPINVLHTVPTALLFSLEGLQEVVDWEKIMKFQSKDGSFLTSLASTACVYMHTGDPKCMQFLSSVVARFGDHVPNFYPLDLFERLWAVDTVERLGIDRHFKNEIKEALDYVYRYWDDERGIGWARENTLAEIDNTVMALRILRLHGYDVSSDVLKNFRDENGEFFCFVGETQKGLTDMLNLYRCSQVAFPGETMMEEAKVFTSNYLRNAIESNNAFDKWSVKKNLPGEVEYALKYPWHRSLPRVEARNYIELFGSDDVWLGKNVYLLHNVSNVKYLELAKLDFNRVQSMHHKEIQDIRRWWIESGFRQLNFTRDRVVEIYFSVAASMFEPEFAACRVAFTKAACLTIIIDDLHDTYGSIDDVLNPFTEAIRRWDLSKMDSLSDELKICFLGFYNTINDLAQEASNAHRWDVLAYFRKLWEVQLESANKEAKWSEAKYVPQLEEYIEIAKVTVGMGTIFLTSIFFMGVALPDHIIHQVDDRSNFLNLACITARLLDDIATFKVERERGELCSAVESYIKDNPGSSDKEALEHLHGILENARRELNWELLKPGQVPDCLKKLLFNATRAAELFCMNGTDGFGMSARDLEDHVKKCLFKPVG
eukprot:Gb_00720 [translate_table: standard]